MNEERSYKLLQVSNPKDNILSLFSNRFRRKVNSFLNEILASGIIINTDNTITLPSGQIVSNFIEIVKYKVYPDIFNLQEPPNYQKIIKILHKPKERQEIESTWISIFK